MSDRKLSERIAEILRMQGELETGVTAIQKELFQMILARLEKVLIDPTELDRIFRLFNSAQHAQLLSVFGKNLVTIQDLNDMYFAEMIDNIGSKQYEAISTQVRGTMLSRFGLSPKGALIKDGYLDTFISDPSVKRMVKQFTYKSQASKIGVTEFTKGLGKLIQGDSNRSGVLDRYYSTYAYDSYQQADRVSQNLFAERLKLTAFIYAGGKIDGTRPFCREKDGKVFLDSECEKWKASDAPGYNPSTDLGGPRCRHHKNYISNLLALNRRKDLIEIEGVLKIASS